MLSTLIVQQVSAAPPPEIGQRTSNRPRPIQLFPSEISREEDYLKPELVHDLLTLIPRQKSTEVLFPRLYNSQAIYFRR
jgi:hypothetical protein